jgi:hypothetical protein
MPALAIREELPATELRRLARFEPDRRAGMRLLAIANALEGMSRAEAARLAGMERQALRDAVLRYNAEGVDGLHDPPRSGRPEALTLEQHLNPDSPDGLAFCQRQMSILAAGSGTYGGLGSRILTDATGESRNPRLCQRFRDLQACRPDPSGESGLKAGPQAGFRHRLPRVPPVVVAPLSWRAA